MGLNTGCTRLIRLHEFLILLSVKKWRLSGAPLVQLPSNTPWGTVVFMRDTSSSRPFVDPIYIPTYYQWKKNVTISLRLVGASVIHAALISLWIKASIKWKDEQLFICFMKFLHILLSHTHTYACC